MTTSERQIEEGLISRLVDGLKYVYRDDIRDRQALEANFRAKFEALNQVRLTDGEFRRLLGEIVTPDVHAALAYYYDHKDEVDRRVAEGEAYAERARAEAPSPLRQKLSAR